MFSRHFYTVSVYPNNNVKFLSRICDLTSYGFAFLADLQYQTWGSSGRAGLRSNQRIIGFLWIVRPLMHGYVYVACQVCSVVLGVHSWLRARILFLSQKFLIVTLWFCESQLAGRKLPPQKLLF